jgi:hypothetical protein
MVTQDVLPCLYPTSKGGGVQKMTLALASALNGCGYQVSLVLCRAEGRLREQVPAGVGLVELKAASVWLGRAYALAADLTGLMALLRPVLLPAKPSRTLSYRTLPVSMVDFRIARPFPIQPIPSSTQVNLSSLSI